MSEKKVAMLSISAGVMPSISAASSSASSGTHRRCFCTTFRTSMTAAFFVGAFLISSSISLLSISVIISASPVYIRKHEIDATQNGHEVRYHQPAAHKRHHLEMRKGRRPDPDTVRHGAAVAGQVIAVDTLGSLDSDRRLSRRDYRSPAYPEKMVDQRFDIVHGTFLQRRRGQGMEGLVRAVRHVVDALPDDAEALGHFFFADHSPGITVAVHGCRNLEIELIISAVGPLLPHVPLKPAGSQTRPGYSPFKRC